MASFDVSALVKLGLPDFQALLSQNPSLSGEWQKIVAHIAADADAGLVSDLTTAVQQAADTMYQAFTGVQNASNDPRLDPVAAAAALTSTNHTSNGAGQVLSGLVSAGLDAGADALRDVAQPLVKNAVQHMAGSLLGTGLAAAGAGLAATGVGAAIGVGASILGSVFASAFGEPTPPPYTIGGVGLDSLPDIVVKYVWAWNDPAWPQGVHSSGPASPYWRRFPDASNRTDAAWFQPQKIPTADDVKSWEQKLGGGKALLDTAFPHSWWWKGNDNPVPRTDARGEQWYGAFTAGDTGKRPIDQACYDNGAKGDHVGAPEVSVYRQLELEIAAPAILGIPPEMRKQFRAVQQAFFQSWKDNRAYGWNGLTTQPDWKVAEHTFTVWNAAHAPKGERLAIMPSDLPLALPQDGPPKGGAMVTSYLMYLLRHYGPAFSQGLLDHSGGIVLNTAPVPVHDLPMPHVIPIKFGPPGKGVVSVGQRRTASLGWIGAAAAAAGAYAALRRR